MATMNLEDLISLCKLVVLSTGPKKFYIFVFLEGRHIGFPWGYSQLSDPGLLLVVLGNDEVLGIEPKSYLCEACAQPIELTLWLPNS